MTLTLTPHQSTHDTFAHDRSVHSVAIAARAVDATKVYGKGEAEVRALDGVTVDFATARFTAIMGPSGSGKSTLMHSLAGLDTLTCGSVFIGDVELGRLEDKKLTKLRRDRIGFIFQAFNLDPDAHRGREHRAADEARRAQARPGRGSTTSSTPSDSATGSPTVRRSCRAVSSSGSRLPGRLPASRTSSSPTSRPGTSTPAPGAEILAFMRQAVRELGQTIVMVTHDPVAASYADRAVFLADGRIVDELDRPDGRQRARPHAHPGSLINVFTHHQLHPRQQGPLPPDRRRRAARRRVHGRHARPDRHHQEVATTTSPPTSTSPPTQSCARRSNRESRSRRRRRPGARSARRRSTTVARRERRAGGRGAAARHRSRRRPRRPLLDANREPAVPIALGVAGHTGAQPDGARLRACAACARRDRHRPRVAPTRATSPSARRCTS